MVDEPKPWTCTGSPGKSHPELENWGDSCIYPGCKMTRPGINPPPSSNGVEWKKPAAIVAAVAILGFGVFGLSQLFKPRPVVVNPTPTTPATTSPTPTVTPAPDWLSSGDRVLIRITANYNRDLGVKAFAAGNYPEAVQLFEKAVQGDRNDPEVQIYLNNAKARQAGSPLKLAAVVPIDGRLSSAQEMLRGVADAQTKFNNSSGIGGRLVEIAIVNDGNDKTRAASVAQQLSANRDILGVIGHNSSGASGAALAEYEKANPPLAMVSPTSSSTSLKSNVFFRTVPSDEASGKKLAEYAKTKLGTDQVAIFYNPNDNYSKSLQQAFEGHFQQLGGTVVRSIDLSDSKLNVENEIQVLQGQVKAIALFPNTDLTSVAIAIARVNAKLQGQKLRLLGGDSLYSPNTLTAGGEAVNGLVLPTAWFAGSQNYAKEAETRWGGRVNWRTATSFDATQTLLKALSNNATRDSVLQNLRSVNLSATETSGEAVQFSPTGDRQGEPFLVKVVKGGSGRPQGSEYGFQLVQP